MSPESKLKPPTPMNSRNLAKNQQLSFITPFSATLNHPTSTFVTRPRSLLRPKPRILGSNPHPLSTSHYRKRQKCNIQLAYYAIGTGVEEEALSMLEFAMSGPGFAACGLFLLFVGVFVFRFAEVGSFSKEKGVKTSYVVRVECAKDKEITVETRRGIRVFRGGGGIEKVDGLEDGVLMARSVVDAGKKMGWNDVRAVVYKMEGVRMVEVGRWPKVGERGILGKGGDGGEGGLRNPSGDGEQIWDEYQRIGSRGPVDKEFAGVLKGLTPIRFERETEGRGCKLCGGKGTKKCHRCGGVVTQYSRNGVECDVCRNTGRLACEWCQGSGNSR